MANLGQAVHTQRSRQEGGRQPRQELWRLPVFCIALNKGFDLVSPFQC